MELGSQEAKLECQNGHIPALEMAQDNLGHLQELTSLILEFRSEHYTSAHLIMAKNHRSF